MEMLEYYDFMQKENYIPGQVVEDGNIITGFGWYFQLFAKIVLTRLGYNIENENMVMPPLCFKAEEIIFHMDSESYRAFLSSEETDK